MDRGEARGMVRHMSGDSLGNISYEAEAIPRSAEEMLNVNALLF